METNYEFACAKHNYDLHNSLTIIIITSDNSILLYNLLNNILKLS
jgi:hypothetical protein